MQICGVPALNYALVSIDEEIFRTKHAANVPRKLKLTITFVNNGYLTVFNIRNAFL